MLNGATDAGAAYDQEEIRHGTTSLTVGPMIETQDLRRTFKSRKTEVEAVRGVDLTVGTGEMLSQADQRRG